MLSFMHEIANDTRQNAREVDVPNQQSGKNGHQLEVL
jgi:hypothetical protein